MRIEAFLLCWNEIDIMPLIIRHYQKFCDKITIYDNYSTDGGPQLAREMGCEVIQFGDNIPNGFNDRHNRDVKNSCWKSSTADWVIVADFDEVLHIPQMRTGTVKYNAAGYVESEEDNGLLSIRELLEICKEGGDTIINTIGWQIMSDEWPGYDLLEITNGYEFKNYAKNVIFSPTDIADINFDFGAHQCYPKGRVNYSKVNLYVLHYKHIGGIQRTIDRYKVLQQRLSKDNRKNGWGIHYNRTPASIRQEWNERMKLSRPLI